MQAVEIQSTREKLGLTQTQFGQLLGVHSMTVSKWERGVAVPTPYQQALINEFKAASKKKEVANSDISGLLLGVGVAAALFLLLSASQKK